MFYVIFFVALGLLMAYILISYWQVFVGILAIAIVYSVWYTAASTGGAELDKAYYCNVLGADETTVEWKNVFAWTQHDERFDRTTVPYVSTFKSTSCAYAETLAAEDPGELGKIENTHSELGYIYRYYYFQDGKPASLYRDNDQFLWQRALILRVDENCTLNRETGVCTELPSAAECSWRDVYSTYDKCEYDTTGRNNLHDIQRENLIYKEIW